MQLSGVAQAGPAVSREVEIEFIAFWP